MNLRQFGEDRLLARLLPSLGKCPDVVLAAGDDCAVVNAPAAGKLIVLKTDCVVEKIHFDSDAGPAAVGWKAMMRPLSDFAAISAVPQFAMVTLVVSPEKSIRWVSEMYRGLRRAAARFRVAIVGGETSGTRGPVVISVSVAGFVEKGRVVSRRNGRARDDLFVTGKLGGSRQKKHLSFVPRIEEARWLTQHFSIHAMMDLSDGLGADLPRLARASKLSYQVDPESLPVAKGCTIRNAVSDGEDYELLFAVSPRDRTRLREKWRRKFPKLLLTRIGSLNFKSKAGNRKLSGGYLHFQ